MPFSAQAAVITGALQQFGQRDFIAQPVAVADVALGLLQPVVDADLRRRASGQQAGACRRTDRTWRERVGEAGAALRDAIEIRRLHFGVTVGAERPRAVIVGEEKQDVRLAGHSSNV